MISPPHHPPTLLPGLDKVKDEAVAYLRRSTFSPRLLLVTGGRGYGKTAVVKAIAAALEIDSDVLSGKLMIAHVLSKLMYRNDI
jgi:tRNA A37 threonylcarbamoyladenosine biosynthesis protein TsaE